jgi:hypothetical protein
MKENSNTKRKKRRPTKDDLEFARRTEEAYKRYEKGEFIEMDFDEFLEYLRKL